MKTSFLKTLAEADREPRRLHRGFGSSAFTWNTGAVDDFATSLDRA